jgi:hypothetical protein
MTRRFVLLSLASVPLCFAQKKKPAQDKGPEVELLEASAHVEDSRLNMDGRLRNVGERPIRKLRIYSEILDSDKKVLTRQQGDLGMEEFEPGEESRFEAQMAYHARAIWFRLEFEDAGGRELRAEKTGPFQIEQ